MQCISINPIEKNKLKQFQWYYSNLEDENNCKTLVFGYISETDLSVARQIASRWKWISCFLYRASIVVNSCSRSNPTPVLLSSPRLLSRPFWGCVSSSSYCRSPTYYATCTNNGENNGFILQIHLFSVIRDPFND